MSRKKLGAARRLQLVVPETDEVVIAWLSMQDNMSMSIREIIKESVARRGLCDHFSSSVADGVSYRRNVKHMAVPQQAQPSVETETDAFVDETLVEKEKPVKHTPEKAEPKSKKKKAESTSTTQRKPLSVDVDGGDSDASDAFLGLSLGALSRNQTNDTDDIMAMMSR